MMVITKAMRKGMWSHCASHCCLLSHGISCVWLLMKSMLWFQCWVWELSNFLITRILPSRKQPKEYYTHGIILKSIFDSYSGLELLHIFFFAPETHTLSAAVLLLLFLLNNAWSSFKLFSLFINTCTVL